MTNPPAGRVCCFFKKISLPLAYIKKSSYLCTRKAYTHNPRQNMNNSGKRKYVLLHWKRLAWQSAVDFLQGGITIITVIGSLIAFLPERETDCLKECILQGWVIVLILIALIAGVLIYNFPRTRAAYKDKKTDIWVIIECCDILQQEGMKVIHTVDTFDTELDRIISPKSLHGAFLQLCKQKNIAIEELLNTALATIKPVRKNKDLPGRKEQYELGTICRVDVEGEPFGCVAFTRLQPNGTIKISKEEYITCLKQMWRNLSNPLNRNDVVNVAVMGNKFVDLPAEFSTEQKIDLMIQTFFAVAREKSCCRVLRICVHPDNAPDIDFEKYPVIIEHLAKRPVI